MLWIFHIDGLPFRKLADHIKLSGKQIFKKVQLEIDKLPWNWELTKNLCDPKRFSNILIIDGKYIKVRGFDRKIPFIYAVDYLTHDIIHGELFVNEDEAAFSQFFQKLYDLGYRPNVIVVDDRQGIKPALNKVFSYTKLQLCNNHFVENIRQLLQIRIKDIYGHFFNSLVFHVFKQINNHKGVEGGLEHVMMKHAKGNYLLEDIIYTIRNKPDLFSYLDFKDCPNNTNLIELYNSHLNGRLKTIKGFQSFQSAQRWLNAWMIRRRTKAFTDCDETFKHLNKHCSLEFTIKKQALWPDILKTLGINDVKYFAKTK